MFLCSPKKTNHRFRGARACNPISSRHQKEDGRSTSQPRGINLPAALACRLHAMRSANEPAAPTFCIYKSSRVVLLWLSRATSIPLYIPAATQSIKICSSIKELIDIYYYHAMNIQFDPFSFGVATFALAVAVMQLYWYRPQHQNAVSRISTPLPELFLIG